MISPARHPLARGLLFCLFAGFCRNYWKKENQMKVLGVSAGRRNGNGEILLKEALMTIQESGDMDVEIVRLLDLDINPCTGCEGCTRSLSNNGTGECVQWKNDDALWLRGKFEKCDALIMSSPVFVIRPSGSFCTMNDRFLGFGPKFLMGVFEKKRIGAAIATGGSDWVQLCLPQMMPSMFMLNLKVVDQLQGSWVGSPSHVLLRDDLIARARKLGRNVATALNKPIEEVEYMGDDPGTCPYCHSDLLTILKNRTAQCPICGIKGEMRIVDDELIVVWNEDDIKHIRWESMGMGRHFNDIKENHCKFAEGKDLVKEKIAKYKSFAPYVKPVVMEGL